MLKKRVIPMKLVFIDVILFSIQLIINLIRTAFSKIPFLGKLLASVLQVLGKGIGWVAGILLLIIILLTIKNIIHKVIINKRNKITPQQATSQQIVPTLPSASTNTLEQDGATSKMNVF